MLTKKKYSLRAEMIFYLAFFHIQHRVPKGVKSVNKYI